MRQVKVRNSSRDLYLAERAGMAVNLLTRFRGLMLRKSLPEGGGLVLIPGGQIHMFFMRIALDVIHVDRQGKILRIVQGIKPWRLGPMVRKSRMVIELPVGTIARTGTEVGDILTLEDVP